jgi:CxxC motif-containing protein (DUF1111 family)
MKRIDIIGFCVLFMAAVVVCVAISGASTEGATIKNKRTGEVLKGSMTDQKVNGQNIFKCDDGRNRYINLSDWVVVEADSATPAPVKTPVVEPVKAPVKTPPVAVTPTVPAKTPVVTPPTVAVKTPTKTQPTPPADNTTRPTKGPRDPNRTQPPEESPVFTPAHVVSLPGPAPPIMMPNVTRASIESGACPEVTPVEVASKNSHATPIKVEGGTIIPLFGPDTVLEQDTIFDTPTALVTRIADRGRDRHCREWMFRVYEHYLPHYWIDRTNIIEVVDTVAKGGTTVTFNMTSQAPLNGPNLRAFFEGKGTVAQYTDNMTSKTIDPLHYQAIVNTNTNEHRPLKLGDRIEIEFSPFIQAGAVKPGGSRTNYYGTALLYVVGTPGFQPWGIKGSLEDAKKNRGLSLDSFPLPDIARNGGMTTSHQNYSDEPTGIFDQMATNMSPIDAQPFMLGRRLAHTNFLTGVHSEPDNPIFHDQVGRLGPRFAGAGCSDCKGGMPVEIGKPMIKYLVRVGTDAKGTPHPELGATMQPFAAKGTNPEDGCTISGWETTSGTYGDGTAFTLKKPVYKFTGITPQFYSVRLAVSRAFGLGLYEAIDENTIVALAATNGGKLSIVNDPETGQPRLGRYGYKASHAMLKQQIAARLNESMGITTTIMPKSDVGSAQQDLSGPSNKLPDRDFENLRRYYGLRAVPARRDFNDQEVQKGEALFASTGCVRCHVPTIKTSPYHPMAEMRNQTIHTYSDFLLHDMGKGLADNMGDAHATGAEWRTAQLWGEGTLAPALGKGVYLHDGRASTLEEAILWHGGEANATKEKFRNLPADDRAAIVRFLKSL